MRLPLLSSKVHPHPDEYRMTVGEHLEELRTRLVLSLVGFVAVAAVCLYLGRDVIIPAFCKPLAQTLLKHGLPTQLHSDEVPDIFAAYLKISLITAAAFTAPWILYQFWQFIASGLYPHERKYITKYIPLSIALLISGMLFVYFFVLPWTLEFFIAFSTGVPLKLDSMPPAPAIVAPATQPAPGATFIQIIDGRPAEVSEGQWWYDRVNGRVEAVLGGQIRVFPYRADNLISTEYKLPKYIDLVVGMLITFGLSFQLPLVVLALVRVGIVERQALKEFRRYAYFAIAVVSAVITPGDYLTATVALIFPLVALYEMGIWLSGLGEKKAVT